MIRTGFSRLFWLNLSFVNVQSYRCGRCQTIFIRWKWVSAAEKKRQNIEALKRWREENTRLFGPILKTKSLKPLGRKTPWKHEKYVVGEDLDAWFNERYNAGHSQSENVQNTSDKTNRVNQSTCAASNQSESEIIKTQKDGQALKEILQCKLTAEIGNNLEKIKSELQRSTLPTLPTVTGILARTRSPESQFYLDRWKAQMIAELGEEGFMKHQTETLKKGINLHICIQQSLSGVSPVQPQPNNLGSWSSIQQVLAGVQDVQALETRITHPYLQYAGTFDCVATYKHTMCLIDWKTSGKPKPHLSNTFDYPLQVCAYIGAYNADPSNTVKIQNGLVVVAYGDGNPAHAHLMTPDQCDYYWRQWLGRLHQYWSSVLYPQHVISTDNQTSLT